MDKLPGAMFVIDVKKENIAVREANRLNIPVIAIVDTDSDPDNIQYPIPGNDDAIRSIKLLTSIVTDSLIEGLQKVKRNDVSASQNKETDDVSEVILSEAEVKKE